MLVPYDEAYASGFEELGTRVPDTSALADLTGWQAELTINDAIDDVIAYERLQLEDTSSAAAAGA
jgi:UDP-glucose 4-epimerase